MSCTTVLIWYVVCEQTTTLWRYSFNTRVALDSIVQRLIVHSKGVIKITRNFNAGPAKLLMICNLEQEQTMAHWRFNYACWKKNTTYANFMICGLQNKYFQTTWKVQKWYNYLNLINSQKLMKNYSIHVWTKILSECYILSEINMGTWDKDQQVWP